MIAAKNPADDERHIVIRLYHGIADHFVLRRTEWAMLWPAFYMWITFATHPDLFQKSASFAAMASWFSESTWGLIFGVAGIVRLAALIINGTFKGFEFSPHIRAVASLVGIFTWGQVSLGFLTSWLTADGLPTAFGIYTLPLILELMNLWRSVRDVGGQFPRRGDGLDGA